MIAVLKRIDTGKIPELLEVFVKYILIEFML